MPYSIIKVKGGYQVVTPNHPEGHSKKPMTHDNAVAQMLIMKRNEKAPESKKTESQKHSEKLAHKLKKTRGK